MKNILVALTLVLISDAATAKQEEVTVEKVYNGWDVDSIYVVTDPARNKWCYVFRNDGDNKIKCFNIKEETKK